MFGPKDESRTPLSSIGEFPLIEHLTSPFKIHHKETVLGVGDDAALIKTPSGSTASGNHGFAHRKYSL